MPVSWLSKAMFWRTTLPEAVLPTTGRRSPSTLMPAADRTDGLALAHTTERWMVDAVLPWIPMPWNRLWWDSTRSTVSCEPPRSSTPWLPEPLTSEAVTDDAVTPSRNRPCSPEPLTVTLRTARFEPPVNRAPSLFWSAMVKPSATTWWAVGALSSARRTNRVLAVGDPTTES